MITFLASAQIWIAVGITEMRRRLNGLGAPSQTTPKAACSTATSSCFAAVAATSSQSFGSIGTAYVCSRKRLEKGGLVWP
jgi:transposase